MAPALAVKYVTMDQWLGSDQGLSDEHDISTWGPSGNLLPQEGWYILGQSPTSGYSAARGIIVYALDPSALGEVGSWVKVWDDKGSGATGDYALWRGIAANPQDYIVIGGIYSNNPGHAPPNPDQTRLIKAVRRDLLVSGPAVWVWDDHKSGADANGSVYTCGYINNPTPSQLFAGVMIPTSSYSQPDFDALYALDPTKVLIS
ncbi:FDS protein [Hymenopellis radicata]|nr:FDS protein [Hymenopellis radicata]